MKPRNPRLSLLSPALSAALLALGGSPALHAADQTWTNSASNFAWDAASTNWTGAAWTNGNNAIFAGAGTGAITVSGTRILNDLTISAAGYSFTGGTLSLSNTTTTDNTWSVSDDTNIASTVSLTATQSIIFNKTGTGKLLLSGPVTITGNNSFFSSKAGTVEFSGGLTATNTGIFAGGGDVLISGGTNVLSGTTNRRGIVVGGNGGTFTVSGGTTTAAALNAANGSSGTYTQTNGSVTLKSDANASVAVTLGGSGNGTTTATINLDGGTLTALGMAPASNWLGTSTVNLNGGTFKSGGNNTDLFNTKAGTNLTGSIFVQSGGAIIDTNSFAVTQVQALLAGSPSGGLTKSGAGTLTLSGANTYSGGTTVSAGILGIGIASTNTGTTVTSGATGTGDVTLANGVALAQSGSTWYVPTLTLQGNITLEGNNRQNVSFKTLDLDGGTRTLFINPTGGNVKQTITGNTALEGTGRSRWETLNDIGTLTVQNGNLVLDTNLTGTNYAGFMFQKASSFAGNAGLTIGANVHLQTVAAGALGSTTANTAKLTVNGIWNLSASTPTSGDQSVYSLAGNGKIYTSMVAGNANARTITLNGTADSTDFSGELSNGPGTGALSIVKTGDSTQIFSGTNSYTGGTTVSGGTLIVSGSIGSSAVTVSTAGTILASGTTGTIGSSVTVNSAAILAAGNRNAAGTATVNGATTMDNGSIFSWDINSTGTSYDKLVTTGIAGEVTAGDAVFQIVAADAGFSDSFWDTNRTWTDVLTTDGTNPISNWADIFSISVVNSSFSSITPVNGSFSLTGNTLTWSAVPEPSSALAGLILAAGLLRRRRN